MKKIMSFFTLTLAVAFIPLQVAAIELHWNYNRFYHDKIFGYRIYMGTSADKIDQRIDNLSKSELTIVKEQPILLQETFDENPGSKYTVTKGSWSWSETTKNMHIDSDEFMIVFEKRGIRIDVDVIPLA